VTQPHAVKPSFDVMVIAAWPPVPAKAGAAGTANIAVASEVAVTMSIRRIAYSS
jgi:hypothetical protein